MLNVKKKLTKPLIVFYNNNLENQTNTLYIIRKMNNRINIRIRLSCLHAKDIL